MHKYASCLSVPDFFVNAVRECLVLGVPLRVLLVHPGPDICNVLDPAVILALGKVVQVGDLGLAGVVLAVGKIVQVGNLGLASVVLGLGPAVQGLDLLLAGVVLGVELALELGNVGDPGLVLLGRLLLERLDLVLPDKIITSYAVTLNR